MTDFGPEDERLEGIYERMEELDPTKFEVEAAKLLHGLGFDKAMMAKGTKDMSGRHSNYLPCIDNIMHFPIKLHGNTVCWVQKLPSNYASHNCPCSQVPC